MDLARKKRMWSEKMVHGAEINIQCGGICALINLVNIAFCGDIVPYCFIKAC